MLKLYCWGGVSEQGRSCFLLGDGNGFILLDCGVKRTFTAFKAGEYPQWDVNLLTRIDTTFLSHAHEDHCGALPFLTKLGIQRPIYTHHLVVPEVTQSCSAWLQAVDSAGHKKPYEMEHILSLLLNPVGFGEKIAIKNCEVYFNSSGHVPGSAWFDIMWDTKRIIYTGDWCTSSLLFSPPEFSGHVDAVVLDGAYGAAVIMQDNIYEQLLGAITATVSKGGSVLLPVPRIGRSQEILVLLNSALKVSVPIYVEAPILAGLRGFLRAPEKSGIKCPAQIVNIDCDEKIKEFYRISEIPPKGEAIILATDAMGSSGATKELIDRLGISEKNTIIFTGFLYEGTKGEQVLKGAVDGIKARVARFIWKVHPDWKDIEDMLGKIKGDPIVIITHVAREKGDELARLLRKKGVKAIVPRVGEIIDL
ncbi:MBL fold metallo-hydrolase [Neomoorella thermoacetica]|uniref:MBL fold metallo-hydrolase n=1 Tax=Neomoorella thermoacetica TaxID=1525 RepID=UPI0008FAF3B3|nr:MBL fold metallo-hydrolase [Moorella thermoacetica]OIQ54290.1 ribonuclease [Moorella thermoacetica]